MEDDGIPCVVLQYVLEGFFSRSLAQRHFPLGMVSFDAFFDEVAILFGVLGRVFVGCFVVWMVGGSVELDVEMPFIFDVSLGIELDECVNVGFAILM